VFDRFYRGLHDARPPAAAVGSCLGLSIVKAIAERHGAKVGLATPADGRGLEVRVTFPSSSRSSAGAAADCRKAA